MRHIDQTETTSKAVASTSSQPANSPWRGVLLLLATVSVTEFMMLNIIFLARAQATAFGLAVAVVWPWVAALVGVTVWSTKERWMPALGRRDWLLQPKVSLGIAAALAMIVLIGRLVTVA